MFFVFLGGGTFYKAEHNDTLSLSVRDGSKILTPPLTF